MLAARPFLKFDDDTTVLTEQFGECIWTVICFAQNNEKQFYLYQSSSCSLASSIRTSTRSNCVIHYSCINFATHAQFGANTTEGV